MPTKHVMGRAADGATSIVMGHMGHMIFKWAATESQGAAAAVIDAVSGYNKLNKR
jgi:hypothetical protein